jgi:hypothetical protein
MRSYDKRLTAQLKLPNIKGLSHQCVFTSEEYIARAVISGRI